MATRLFLTVPRLAILVLLVAASLTVLERSASGEHEDGSIADEVNYNAVYSRVHVCDNSNFIGSQRLEDAVGTWNAIAQGDPVMDITSCGGASVTVIYTDGGCGGAFGCTTHPLSQSPENFTIKMDATADDHGPAHFTKVLIHELGHNMGFLHLTPGQISGDGRVVTATNSVMVPGYNPPSPITPQLIDQENYEKAYRPGALAGFGPYSWYPGEIVAGCETINQPHTEAAVNFYRYDAGQFLFAGAAGSLVANCPILTQQMPGTRAYYAISASHAYRLYNGDFVVASVNVQGTNPSVTSLVPYSYSVMQVNWTFGNPTGTEVHIDRKNCPGCTFSPIATTASSPFVDTGLQPGTTYYYRIRGHHHPGCGGCVSGGFSNYSGVVSATTPPPFVPAWASASFNIDGDPNKVNVCFPTSGGATTYEVLFFRGGAGTGSLVNVSPNSSCYGSVLLTSIRVPDAYHIAVRACYGASCSAYRDVSGAYWWWIPCSSPSCPAGGAADGGAHTH